MAIGPLFSAAVQGIQNQVDAMNGAANEVLIASTDMGGTDSVSISGAAKTAAAGGGAPAPSLEHGLVNLNVSKYLAVANMKVLQTGDEMTQDLTDMVQPSGS
ncbi:MAG TPA: hypothetical protein VMI54_11460 [Polyangiaceae bacterium]|nr:hypothetical protein [Polyangiaceae bacterium]